MPEATEILVFNLTGKTRDPEERSLKERLAAFVRPAAPRATGLQETDTVGEAAESENTGPAGALNKNAEAIAKTLEAEILAALPPDPSLSVRVELRFRSGSLVMIGTAAILSWIGSIILETVRDELAEIVKIATQRAIGAAIAEWAPGAGAMHCTVTPRRSAAAGIRPERSTAASGQASTFSLRGGIPWRSVLTGFLTLAVLVLLIDRFLDVSLRTTQRTAVLAPAAHTSQVATQPASLKP